MAFFSDEAMKKLKKRNALPGSTSPVKFLPTGLYSLDYAIGGGFPMARVTEISGRNGSAKTTLALLSALKQVENGRYVALLETENALDLKWLVTLGFPIEEIYMGEEDKDMEKCHLHIWHPEYLESALETMLFLYRENKYAMIILDSFGASPVRAAAEGTMEDTIMMKRAKVGHQFKEAMSATLPKGEAAVVMVNQVYFDMTQQFYDKLKPEGGKWVSSGGESIPFLAGLRIFMENPMKIEDEKVKGLILGKEHRGMIFKNKTGRPVPQKFNFHLMLTPSPFIDMIYDIRTTALALEILDQRGRFWYYNGQNIAGSEADINSKILKDISFSQELEEKIAEKIKGVKDEGEQGTQESDVGILSEDSED